MAARVMALRRLMSQVLNSKLVKVKNTNEIMKIKTNIRKR